jgi:hypothetical protein
MIDTIKGLGTNGTSISIEAENGFCKKITVAVGSDYLLRPSE